MFLENNLSESPCHLNSSSSYLKEIPELERFFLLVSYLSKISPGPIKLIYLLASIHILLNEPFELRLKNTPKVYK